MKACLIDTDILSEFFRGNAKVINNIARYLKEYNNLNLSIISYYEMLNGLLYKDAQKQLSIFNEFVELNNIIPLSVETVKNSAEIYALLRKKGQVISHTDTLIAGIAITNNLQLVTNNVKHFKRIEDLQVINWLK